MSTEFQCAAEGCEANGAPRPHQKPAWLCRAHWIERLDAVVPTSANTYMFRHDGEWATDLEECVIEAIHEGMTADDLIIHPTAKRKADVPDAEAIAYWINEEIAHEFDEMPYDTIGEDHPLLVELAALLEASAPDIWIESYGHRLDLTEMFARCRARIEARS